MAEGDVPEPTSEQPPKPEDMAKSLEMAAGLEKKGWKPLKPLTQRFTIGGTGDPSKASEQRLGEVAATPPDLSSSQWRRDSLASIKVGPPPESVPLISPDESKAMGLGEQKRSSETLEGREIEAAHQRLDQLGVPQTRELGPDETVGEKKATHLLRLHGRLRLLQEELAKRGVDNLFPKKS